MGLALLLEGREVEAQATWLSVIATGSSTQIETWSNELIEFLYTNAQSYQNIGKFIQAEQIFWQILDQNLCHEATYESLTKMFIQQERVDDVINLWKRTFEIQAECPQLNSKVGSLLNSEILASMYRPEVFYVNNIADAKSIILTPERGTSTEERWEKETPYLVDQLGKELKLKSTDIVLDYGCGIGRLAKEIIAIYDCTVLGVDISNQMLQLAISYINSPKFIACSPTSLDRMITNGLKVNHAYSIWVIQHCLDPHLEINRINYALKTGGYFYIVNSHHRCFPSDRVWINDKIDIAKILKNKFKEINNSTLPESITTQVIAQHAFCMTLQKLDD